MPITIETATPSRASDPAVPADWAADGTVAAVTSGRPARWPRAARLVPGLAAAIVLAIVATFLGRLEPVIGGPVFGIVLGMLVATFRRGTGVLKPGAAFASSRRCRLNRARHRAVAGAGSTHRPVLARRSAAPVCRRPGPPGGCSGCGAAYRP